MKFIKYFFFLFVLINLCLVAGCYPALDVKKEQMLDIYSNNENYVCLSGEVIYIESGETFLHLTISYGEKKEEQEYSVFSNYKVDLQVGDKIEYITVLNCFYDWLPIVSIVKDGTILLPFEEGKNCLIEWVTQLRGK